MNIAISGYGRMGKEVEKVALLREHRILTIVDKIEEWKKIEKQEKEVNAIIDFSLPETAFSNIVRSFTLGIPIVTGTTGWYDHMEEVIEQCKKLDGTLFYAPNFSIGVNVFFNVNRHLAKLMNGIEGYKVTIEETHHVHKLDAPSGTAIKAANDLISEHEKLAKWVNTDEIKDDELAIISNREGEVTGIHKVVYDSDFDKLILKHESKSRAGFALGAVLAAEFVVDKKGVYTMDDLLKF